MHPLLVRDCPLHIPGTDAWAFFTDGPLCVCMHACLAPPLVQDFFRDVLVLRLSQTDIWLAILWQQMLQSLLSEPVTEIVTLMVLSESVGQPHMAGGSIKGWL